MGGPHRKTYSKGTQVRKKREKKNFRIQEKEKICRKGRGGTKDCQGGDREVSEKKKTNNEKKKSTPSKKKSSYC